MAIIGWRAWYAGGSHDEPLDKYDSITTSWDDLPHDGVLAIVLYEDTIDGKGNHYRIPYAGYDYYFKAEGIFEPIYGVDVDKRERDTMQEISDRYSAPSVKRGIWVDNTTMRMVENEVKEARQWP